MRHSFIIPAMLVSAIVLGGLLYLYGGPAFTEPLTTENPAAGDPRGAQFQTIAKGQSALSQDRRANFRIKTPEEFARLWEMIYSNNGPALPYVDFSREEVIAAFDGSHSTGGYGVTITEVRDADGVRTVKIERTEPGEACAVTTGIESPFHLVRVDKSVFPLVREESIVITPCL